MGNGNDFPTGPGRGFRVVFDVIDGRYGWTVLSYERAYATQVPGIGVMSREMARVVASRLAS